MKKLNKIAIVTGGSSGIGRSISSELLKNGYKVFICGRTIDKLTKTVNDISHLGNVDYFQLDISDKKAIQKFSEGWLTNIDVLINNAGICGIEKLEDDTGLWEDILSTNLHGVYYLTRGLIKYINFGGAIVNISSQLGLEGRAGFGAYCASKHALLGITKCWAKELGDKNIRVNAVCPGWVKTEMAMNDIKKMAEQRSIKTDQLYKEICNELDLKRFVKPEEVAELVSFLISNKSNGITGQIHSIR